MPYKLAEYHGDTLAVPQLVVSHLTQTDGDTIRAALDRKSTRLNSSHVSESRMPSSA